MAEKDKGIYEEKIPQGSLKSVGDFLIPPIIHYCWFGRSEMPMMVKECIESWKKFCPDYEIIRWDETNTNLNENDYIKEAYENGKWAFITDYIRLKVLYEHGGIYMDTDVQVCKTLDPFLIDSAFSGFENVHQIPTGIMASEAGHPFLKKLLDYYIGRHFVNQTQFQNARRFLNVLFWQLYFYKDGTDGICRVFN